MSSKRNFFNTKSCEYSGSRFGDRLSDYPSKHHGLSSNRFGGNQLQRLRGFRGPKSSHGPVVRPPLEEIEAVAQRYGATLGEVRRKPTGRVQ